MPQPFHPGRLILPFLLGLLSAPPALSDTADARAWMTGVGYVPPSNGRMVICHGYGCTRRMAVSVDPAWLTAAGATMRNGRASPAAERKALGTVIRSYTARLPKQLGGSPDAPKSPPSLSGTHGQMDCLDVSANTTSLLLVLKERGLVVHHDVEEPSSRGLLLDGRYPHTSAVVSEIGSGTAWAVDPWSREPGGNPDIIPLAQWKQEG